MDAPNSETLAIEIVTGSAAWQTHPDVAALISRALATAAAAAGIEAASRQVTVVLGDDALQRRLNREWRGTDASTNVLSFPAAPFPAAAEPRPLGDVVLAYETVSREALASGRPFEAHVAHLATHGFLHLLGYDHENDPDAERMERLETLTLLRLGFDDPYADLSTV